MIAWQGPRRLQTPSEFPVSIVAVPTNQNFRRVVGPRRIPLLQRLHVPEELLADLGAAPRLHPAGKRETGFRLRGTAAGRARRSKRRAASASTFRILRTAMALRPGQPSAGTRTAAGSNSSRATATPAGPSRLQARRAFTKRLSAVTSCAPTRTAREKYVKS